MQALKFPLQRLHFTTKFSTTCLCPDCQEILECALLVRMNENGFLAQ